MLLKNSSYKPQLCASKDLTRPHMCCAQLDVEKQCLVTCDGHRLVSVPVDVEPTDTTGPISIEAIVEAQRLGKKDESLGKIGANGDVRLTNNATYPRPDVTFPPYEQVIDHESAPVTTIGLNANYLWEICQALGGSKANGEVVLTFSGNDGPIRVTRHKDYEESFGILMPVRIN